MSAVLLRTLVGVPVFLGVFFCPFHFLLFSPSPGFYSWQSLNQQTNESTATLSPSTTGQQPVEIQQPPAEDKDKSPPTSPQPEEQLTLPRPSMAAESPPVEDPQIIKRVEVAGKVGISFDDGPFPGMTEKYLDVLEKYNIRATFFMMGRQVSLHPEAVRKVIEQGSEIGSHSWRHDRLDQLDTEQVLADLQSVAEQVYSTVGREISLFRPPYGRHSGAVASAAQELKQRLILWDVDPRDWEDPSSEKIVAAIMEQTKPGSIIILHEGHNNTLQALPAIIERLRERGLEPVPVSELLN